MKTTLTRTQVSALILGVFTAPVLLSAAADSSFFTATVISALVLAWVAFGLKTVADHTAECASLKRDIERQRLALSESDNGLWDFDLIAAETYRNVHWGEMLGYEADEQDGMPTWEEMVHPEDLREVKRILEIHLEGHSERFKAEYRMKHRSGAWIWVLDQGRVVSRGDDGTPLRLVGTHRDVTELKEAQVELETARAEVDAEAERQRLALQSTDNGVWDIDLTTGTTFHGANWARMLGYDPDDDVIPSWEDLVHPEDLPEAREAIEKHIAGETDVGRVEYRMRKKNGEWMWVLDQGRVVEWNEDGEPVRAVGAYRDISDLKRVQLELQDARAQADAAAVAKGQFLAAMSHEIRTPMNGVIGMTDLLLDTELTDEQRDMANTVKSSGEALLTIINSILDFSKIEAGKVILEQIDFDFRTMLEETLEVLSGRAADNSVELAQIVNHAVPQFVNGDPGRVRQVITNLVGNAIKFAPEGEVTVKVSLESENEVQTRLKIEIEDNGIGIPIEAQETLFEPFTQADASTTRKFGGTGLGLSISRELVHLMGGEMSVSSEPGRGSTFSFTACFGKSARVDTFADIPAEIKGTHLLVVDDTPVNVLILEEQLTSWGIQVDSVPSGESALRLLAEKLSAGEMYDAALLDMNMPDIDGIELARRLKASSPLSEMPLILLTSGARKGDAGRAERAGFDAYLPKPIRMRILRRCLKSVLGRRTEETGRDRLVTQHTIAEQEAAQRPVVLLVEDNKVNQKLACRMLERSGYRADVVENGKEAIDAFRARAYGAILMDCQMPVMDGYDATARIRELESGTDSHVPVIALTAHAMDGDRDRCLAVGMDDYLSKPVKMKLLADMLEKWVGGAAPATQ